MRIIKVLQRDRGVCGLVRERLTLPAFIGMLLHSSCSLAAVDPLGPASIDAGPVAITPTLGMELKYRDNIYLQERNTTDSWITVARPAVNARIQDRENYYQLDYQGKAGWYQESSSNDDNDYFDHTFSGDTHLEFSDRWVADGKASWASLHEDRGTGLSEGLVGQVLPKPVRYDQTDVAGSVQYGAREGTARLLFNAGYMDREYQNFTDITRTRDRDETTLGTTFFYPVAPKTDLLIEYTYRDIHYPNPFNDAPPLDSSENFLLAGATWEITPNLTSTAKAGYVDKNFDNSAREDWDGLGWSLELWMQPRDQDTIMIQSSRRPRETTRQGNFIKREVVTGIWTHDWSDRIYTELAALYGRDSYEKAVNDRKDDIYNFTFRVGYEFRRWANVYTGYSYDDKNSNVENLSYTDNVFMVGVELSL